MTNQGPAVPRMFVTIQGLSWQADRTRGADRRAARDRRRPPRARFHVEALEPRWLLSAADPTADDDPKGPVVVDTAVNTIDAPMKLATSQEMSQATALPVVTNI